MANLPPPPPRRRRAAAARVGRPHPRRTGASPNNRPELRRAAGRAPVRTRAAADPVCPGGASGCCSACSSSSSSAPATVPTSSGKEISYGATLSQVKAGDVAKSNYNNASGRITGETTQRPGVHDLRPDAPLPDADQKPRS